MFFMLFLTQSLPAETQLLVQKLNLKQSVEYAIEHSPTLNSAIRELTQSQLEKSNALSKFFPSLDLSSTHGLQKDSGANPLPYTSQISLGLTESLYNNGTNTNHFRQAGLKLEKSDLSYRNERDKLVRDITIEFLNFTLAHELHKIGQNQYGLLKKQYELVTGDYFQGLKTRKDYLRFKTQINRAEIDLVSSLNEIEKSKLQLQKLLAIPLNQGPIDFEAFTLITEDIQKIPAKAPPLSEHIELRIANLQRKINSLDTDLVRRQYWPELNLNSALTYGSSKYIGTGTSFRDNAQVGWNALITLNYNFWDWGIRRREVEISEQKEAILSNVIEQRLQELKTEIQKTMLGLEQLQRNFKLSTELLALEENNFSLLEKEYRHGKVAYIDLITGIRDLSDAKVKYYTTLVQLKQLMFTYRYHEGTIYERFHSL